MKLIDKFIVKKPDSCSGHYELFVEGDWNDLFEDSDIQWDYLPSFNGQSIHTVTKVRLEFVSGGIRYPVEIPYFYGLFQNDEEKKIKVINARGKEND